MPNGYQGSKTEWDRLEAPLRRLDARLERYAADHAMDLGRNGHGWPERSLSWGDVVRKKLQIYLHDGHDDEAPTFHVWLVAFQERDGRHYSSHEFLREGVSADDLDASLDALLERGRATLEAWPVERLAPPSGR